uniref:Uncharacterized protein n=1 Tax=Nymphaea colorata TaxID=210225 RepID=A0A5K1ADF7_9MAGN
MLLVACQPQGRGCLPAKIDT